MFTESDQRNIAAGAAGSIAIKEIDGRNLGGSQTVVVISAATVIKETRRGVRVLIQSASPVKNIILLVGFMIDAPSTILMRIDLSVFWIFVIVMGTYVFRNIIAASSVLMLRQQAVRHRAGGVDDEHRCGLRVAGLGLGGRVHLHLQRDPVLVGVAGRHSGLADGINAFNGGRLSAVAVLVLDPSIAVVMAVDYVRLLADLIRQHVQRQQRQGHDEHQDPRKQPLSCFLPIHKKFPPSLAPAARRRKATYTLATGCRAVGDTV